MNKPKKGPLKKGASSSLYICLLVSVLSLIFFSLAEAQEAVTKLKVVTEMANIRLKPDVGSIIIYQVPLGTILESTAKEGEWYLIKTKTEEGETVSGYVHESIVIVLEQPAEEKVEKVPEKEVQRELEKKEKIEQKPLPQAKPTIAPPYQPFKFHIEFSVSGGGNYVSAEDLNSGAKGVADLREDELEKKREGTFTPAHLSYIFGGEVAFSLSSRLLLGLGADYFLGQKQSQAKFSEGLSIIEIVTVRPKFKALPLRLFLAYHPFSFLYLKGGVEYYFAKCFYFYKFQREGSPTIDQEGEAKARGFGLMGGLVLERKLSSVFSFFLEATCRYAKIKGFEGTHTEKQSNIVVSTQEGKLYYFYKSEISAGTRYPQLYIREKKPTEAFVYDPREAVMDFSGISLKTGFKVRF